MTPEIEQLIHDVLHGRADDEQRLRLSDWIAEREDNARAYYRVAMDERAIRAGLECDAARSLGQLADSPDDSGAGLVLAELARAEAKAHPPLVAVAGARRASWLAGRGQPLAWAAGVMLAAVIALAVILLVQNNDLADQAGRHAFDLHDPPAVTPWEHTPAERLVVATLTGQHDAQWRAASGADVPGIGDGLSPGQRLQLIEGFAEITTRHGAVAVIEAPATIELLDSDNALRLHAGKLVGICESAASKGFVVRTPQVDVTDLGTRFGVDASELGATEVHVFEGEVLVTREAVHGGAAVREQLVGGQAVRASDDRAGLTRLGMDREQFAEALPIRYLPEGTGYGLEPGDTDPNWRVVAMNGRPITEGGAMSVTYPRYGDPASSRWVFVPRGIQAQDTSDRTITCRVSLRLPSAFDPGTSQLVLGFNADHRVSGVRVNGTAVQVPDNKLDRSAPLTELAIQAYVRPGINTVEVDLYDNDSHSALRAAFEIREASP